MGRKRTGSVWIEEKIRRNGKVYLVRHEINGKRQPAETYPVLSQAEIRKGKILEMLENLKSRLTNVRNSLKFINNPDELTWSTFAGIFTDYLDERIKTGMMKEVSKISFYLPALTKFGEFIGRERVVNSITEDDISKFIDYLKNNGHISNGIELLVRQLKTIFRWGCKNSGLSLLLSFKSCPRPLPVGRDIPNSVLSLLIDFLPPLAKRMLIFSLFTGVRGGELINSNDWNNVTIHQSGEWEFRIKNGKLKSSSNQPVFRLIYLPREAILVMGKPRPNGQIFETANLTYLGMSMRRTKIEILKKTGQEIGRIRPHDLRHTLATRYLQTTKDLKALMDHFGWVNEKTALIYQHPTEERKMLINTVKFDNISHFLPTNNLKTH